MNELEILENLKINIIDKYFDERDNDKYFESFKQVLNFFKQSVESKEYKDILKKINNINTEVEEDRLYKFYQLIAEIVIGNHLINNFKDSYKSEVKLIEGKKTDVDYQIKYKDITYNIEIKCPNLRKKDEYYKNKSTLKSSILSRFETIEESNKFKDEIKEEIIDPIIENSNYKFEGYGKLEDNKVNDFLSSCQKKFPESVDFNHLNVLIIALDSPMDIFEWNHYFTNELTGFFANPYISPKEFNKVDIIVLSNLVAGHRNLKKLKEFQSWEIDNYFNYFLVNAFSKKMKESNKFTINNIYNVLKNNGELSNYNRGNYFLNILNMVLGYVSVQKELSEIDLISLFIDYIYDKEPYVYMCIIAYMNYYKDIKQINDTKLNEVYSFINDIIPNDTIEFNKFRDDVQQYYYEKTGDTKVIRIIENMLFNDFINEKYKILLDND